MDKRMIVINAMSRPETSLAKPQNGRNRFPARTGESFTVVEFNTYLANYDVGTQDRIDHCVFRTFNVHFQQI